MSEPPVLMVPPASGDSLLTQFQMRRSEGWFSRTRNTGGSVLVVQLVDFISVVLANRCRLVPVGVASGATSLMLYPSTAALVYSLPQLCASCGMVARSITVSVLVSTTRVPP